MRYAAVAMDGGGDAIADSQQQRAGVPMKYILGLLGLLLCLSGTPAKAQDALVVQTCGTLPLAYAPGATRLLTVDVNGKMCTSGGGGGSTNPGGTNGQIQYNNSNSFGGFTMSGDATIVPSTGVITVAKSNGSAFGTAAFANTGTGGGSVALLNGLNTWSAQQTFSAVLLSGIIGSTQCLHVNSSGVVSGTGSDCGAGGGSGTVTSVSAGCGTSTGGSPITTAGTVSSALTLRSNTAASDTVVSTDCGNAVYENRATSVAVAIAQAGTVGFGAGTYFAVCNINAGVATITPTTSTIGGASSLALQGGTALQPNCVSFQSDGTNYNLLNPVAGANVAAAFGTALSAAGGLTTTIASGTSALGTGAIGSAACATVVTTTATNTATTDVVLASFNGDPHAVTGYIPSTSGMLTIISYPTANNVNFLVCNNTSGSITPGAITLNWLVVR